MAGGPPGKQGSGVKVVKPTESTCWDGGEHKDAVVGIVKEFM